MKNTNFSEIFARIFIIICSILITIIVVDQISIHFLSHRKSAVEKKFSIQDVRKPMPYVMFKGAPHAKAWKKFSKNTGLEDNILNALGYPGEAPAMPKPANEYRIVVLGGSAAFMGNPAIPRLIQHQFEKNQCFAVKVFNFSVVSSVTSMELARLIHEVVNYSPNLIVSYSGFNDIDEPFVADPRPGYPFNYFISESNPILDSEIREYPLVPLIAYGSNLMRYFFPSYFLRNFADLNSLRKEVGYGTQPWKQAIVDAYIENMIKSHKTAHAFDAEFMAFFQPALYFKDTITPIEQNFIVSERMNSSLELRAMILEEAQNIKKDEGVSFFDFSDFFDDYNETVFVDRVHLHYQYRPEVAKEIYNHIVQFMQKDKDAFSRLTPSCLGQ